MTYLSHLECSECGQTYSAHELYTLRKKCGAPLWVRYDLDRARQELDRGWLTSHEKIVSLNTGAWWKNP